MKSCFVVHLNIFLVLLGSKLQKGSTFIKGWFKNIFNKTQILPVNTRIGQDTTLEPLIFIFYTNDVIQTESVSNLGEGFIEMPMCHFYVTECEFVCGGSLTSGQM